MILNKCRLCKSKKLFQFLDLGFHPPSDQFKMKVELNNPTIYYPLKICSCISCGFKQLNYVVEPKILYQRNYPYESSLTKTGKKHWFEFAESIVKEYNLKKNERPKGVRWTTGWSPLMGPEGTLIGQHCV